ncbi:hypothetical protein BofuT4_uP071130.1 [Botrytis cinerea T4]|uniref:Uncharacterized protein n=1 Tax=Botryotinia fuckeliana (strain T4) TaxID=999810 RepID=G2XPS9_BOTF4|nr:hypothetical protein BofuT4_uP071130.1 [Botrytis cinerea T4]
MNDPTSVYPWTTQINDYVLMLQLYAAVQFQKTQTVDLLDHT